VLPFSDALDDAGTLTGAFAVWAEHGGIVGRGVLLDYAEFAQRHAVTIDPFSASCIPFAHLQRLVDEKGIVFRTGDILFVRTGFTAAYNALSSAEQEAIPQRPRAEFMGVESTTEVLRWLWENQFAAVAGDAPAFESSPVGRPGIDSDTVLHQWLLAGWGMPIGEQFDLERLAAHCREIGRWSFFVSSVPLKVGLYAVPR
jgi:kynurenine formamidase